MWFRVNEEKKIIFGWSTKCGCTHVKNLINFLENKIVRLHDPQHSENELPQDLNKYIIIIFIRNPYKRIISGLFHLYQLNGIKRNLWNIEIPITFTNFVEKLIESNYDVIDHQHFSCQTSGFFNENIKMQNQTIIYDIEHIDYEYIGSLYNKTIPPDVIQFRGNHINKNTEPFNDFVYDLELDTYSDKKITIEHFYNDVLKDKLIQIYKKDFEFFESKGFYYSCKQTDDLMRDHSKCLSKINTYNSSKYKNRKNVF